MLPEGRAWACGMPLTGYIRSAATIAPPARPRRALLGGGGRRGHHGVSRGPWRPLPGGTADWAPAQSACRVQPQVGGVCCCAACRRAAAAAGARRKSVLSERVLAGVLGACLGSPGNTLHTGWWQGRMPRGRPLQVGVCRSGCCCLLVWSLVLCVVTAPPLLRTGPAAILPLGACCQQAAVASFWFTSALGARIARTNMCHTHCREDAYSVNFVAAATQRAAASAPSALMVGGCFTMPRAPPGAPDIVFVHSPCRFS